MSKYKGRRFLAIDGEAVRGKYVLLADSLGRSVENLDGLSTLECLDFLAQGAPRSASWTRVGFGLHYDVNMWVSDLPAESRLELFSGDMVTFGPYQLEYLANRIFTIRSKGETRARIYDCLGMFRRSFVDVVTDWLGECPPIILEGKGKRERFKADEMEFVRAYNQAECAQLVAVLGHVDTFLRGLPGGGVKLRGWYGAGAIAASWLRRAGARRLMRRFDERHVGRDLLDAFGSAYHGGRVEARLIGTIGPVWRYDLNSAYAWAITHMGRLSYRWIPSDRFAPDSLARMSVWRVAWSLPSGSPLGPFPVRDSAGAITYPLAGSGYYWWPEVRAARQRWGARRIQVDHGWICQEGARPIGIDDDEHGTHTLGIVLKTMYQYRHHVGARSPGGRLLKLALAAVWGKFAQWNSASIANDDEPGFWYCQPWAGWVTSCIRATLISAMGKNDDAIVAISTDGVVSTRLLDLPISDNLGAWRVEQFDQGTFILPGLFRLSDASGAENVEKTRGFERAQFDWSALLHFLNRDHTATIKVRRFVGHVLPDLWPEQFGEMRCKFVTVPIKVQPAAIIRKRLGGDLIKGSFKFDQDHAWTGAHDGNRDYMSQPPKGRLIRDEMKKNDETDGQMDALI